MARAKTTDRAEARRRHRAELAAEAAEAAAQAAAAEATGEATADAEPNELSGEATPNGAAPGRLGRFGMRPSARSRAVPARAAGPAGPAGPIASPRPSILGALRAAAAPADIRSDIEALPQIARRTKAVWIPAVLIIGTGVAFLVPAMADNQIVRLLGVTFLAPPPMIPAFLAGMLTSRGSWLTGLIAGLLSGVVVAVLITVSPSTTSTTRGLDIQNVGFLVIAGPLFGLSVGAFSGFYRRFLALSSPPRRQQPARKPSARSKGTAARRR